MWFDILKNIQISSQRTGSKDYVTDDDDDDCKERFIAVQNKVKNLEIEGLAVGPIESGNPIKGNFFDNKRREEDKKANITRWFGSNDLEFSLYFDESIPNEIYCYAIEQYENTIYGTSEVNDYGEYRILTEKGGLNAYVRGNEEGDSYNTDYFNIYILPLANTREVSSAIIIVHRIFYDGTYGSKGKNNAELSKKINKVIRELLVF